MFQALLAFPFLEIREMLFSQRACVVPRRARHHMKSLPTFSEFF